MLGGANQMATFSLHQHAQLQTYPFGLLATISARRRVHVRLVVHARFSVTNGRVLRVYTAQVNLTIQ